MRPIARAVGGDDLGAVARRRAALGPDADALRAARRRPAGARRSRRRDSRPRRAAAWRSSRRDRPRSASSSRRCRGHRGRSPASSRSVSRAPSPTGITSGSARSRRARRSARVRRHGDLEPVLAGIAGAGDEAVDAAERASAPPLMKASARTRRREPLQHRGGRRALAAPAARDRRRSRRHAAGELRREMGDVRRPCARH